jgi:NitT/TauT family transport system ATP-binding protein
MSDIVINVCAHPRGSSAIDPAKGLRGGLFGPWHDACTVPRQMHFEASPMTDTVRVDYITHYFKGQTAPTLSDIDLTIHTGEQVALIGRSGCGKSTLLHMLAGLLMPSEGCVRIHGHQVTRPSAQWNMMFQKPSLYPWMSVADNVGLGLAFAGRKDPQRVADLLALVGLSDKATANPQSLSGGQQQRVALARSLATSPEMLLLDEPFSALDAFTRASLQDEVSRIAREQNLTMVMVTHDIEEAVAMADRVLIMSANPGRIVGEMQVDLPFPRQRATPAYSRARENLMKTFEALVGGEGAASATENEDSEPAGDREAA